MAPKATTKMMRSCRLATFFAWPVSLRELLLLGVFALAAFEVGFMVKMF